MKCLFLVVRTLPRERSLPKLENSLPTNRAQKSEFTAVSLDKAAKSIGTPTVRNVGQFSGALSRERL